MRILIFTGRSVSLDSMLYSVRYLTPAGHFGEYLYSNSGMMTVGKIVEKISGQRWEDFYKARLFAPLGMTRSSVEREAYIPHASLRPAGCVWLQRGQERHGWTRQA